MRNQFELPVTSVARRALIGVFKEVAAHDASESVILGKSVSHGLFVVARVFVRDDITYHHSSVKKKKREGIVRICSAHMQKNRASNLDNALVAYRLLRGRVGCRDCQ